MSITHPSVSIVLPVHNGAKYLLETLAALSAQTYPHFNILVLENASDDATPAILNSIQDTRLQIFPSDRLLSIEENWQRIQDLPLAEWMTIVSHDDLLYPDFLSTLMRLTQTEPDASLYTSHFNLIDAEGDLIRASHPAPFRENGDTFLERRHLWQADSFGTGYLMRSADYRQVGGIPHYKGLYYADDVLWATLSNLRGRVCSPDHLFAYRYYRGSTARLINLLDLYHNSVQYLDYLQTRPYFSDAQQQSLARAYVARHLNRTYQRFLVNLISECDAKEMRAYYDMKAQLLHLSARDQRFPVYNTVLRIIEQIARIPFRAGRVGMLRMMEKTAIWLRKFSPQG